MKLNPKLSKQKQKGYSLIELSVALSIVAVVIVAGLVGARQVLLSNSVNSQIRESNQTISKLRKALARQTDTAGLTGSNAGLLGVWPNDRSSCTAGVCTNRSVFNQAFEHAFTNTAAHGDNLPINVIGHLASRNETDYLSAVQVAFQGCEDQIMRSRTPGFMQMLTHSHRYVVPVQMRMYDGKPRELV